MQWSDQSEKTHLARHVVVGSASVGGGGDADGVHQHTRGHATVADVGARRRSAVAHGLVPLLAHFNAKGKARAGALVVLLDL